MEFIIDGGETPVYTASMIDIFNNQKPPFNYEELNETLAGGKNFFVPIVFEKSIELRTPGKLKDRWGKYYQITYSLFPKGTKVPSFKGSFSDKDKEALKKANDVWGKRGPKTFVSEKAKTETSSVEIKPGKEKEIVFYKKPGAITSIVMDRPDYIEADRKASIKILRELAISITWDDDKKPAVWSPLGDFFGTAAGENLFKTLMTGMTEKNYYVNWYMPYKKAKIVVRNDGKEKRTLNFTIHTEKVKGDVDKLLRFHCKWQRDNFSGFDKESLFSDRWPDWPVLKVDGAAGRFCGFQAHMWNPNHLWSKECREKFARPMAEGKNFEPGGILHHQYKGVAGGNSWWGEGDEKFFVDGEKMPSTFGTGTEDYFGYAWGTAEAFDSALQAQPLNGGADEIGKKVDNRGPGNIGHISNVRWQIANNCTFP